MRVHRNTPPTASAVAVCAPWIAVGLLAFGLACTILTKSEARTDLIVEPSPHCTFDVPAGSSFFCPSGYSECFVCKPDNARMTCWQFNPQICRH